MRILSNTELKTVAGGFNAEPDLDINGDPIVRGGNTSGGNTGTSTTPSRRGGGGGTGGGASPATIGNTFRGAPVTYTY